MWGRQVKFNFTGIFLVLGRTLSRPLSSTTIPFHFSLSSFPTFVYELCKFYIIHSVHYSYYHPAKNVYQLVNVTDYMNYGVENALDKLIQGKEKQKRKKKNHACLQILHSWLQTRVPSVLSSSPIPAKYLFRTVQKLRTHKASHKFHTHIFQGTSFCTATKFSDYSLWLIQ